MQDKKFPEKFLEIIDSVVRARPDARHGVRAAAVVIAMRYQLVSVDDLRDCLDVAGDQRWFGGVLRSLETWGVLEKHGYEKTRRKSSHGRDVVVYKLTLDWEKFWPATEVSPKAKITFGSDGNMYIEQRSFS